MQFQLLLPKLLHLLVIDKLNYKQKGQSRDCSDWSIYFCNLVTGAAKSNEAEVDWLFPSKSLQPTVRKMWLKKTVKMLHSKLDAATVV